MNSARVSAVLISLLLSVGVGAIEVYQAKPIQVVPPAAEPGVVQAAEPKVVAPGPTPRTVQAAEPRSVTPAGSPATAGGGAATQAEAIPGEMLGRRWQLRVPGGAWQTENRAEGTRTLHVAPGSGKLDHELVIRNNGEYLWRAYGKRITGRWEAGVRRGYPLTLRSAYEGKDWHATLEKGELLLWDGNSLAGQFRGR